MYANKYAAPLRCPLIWFCTWTHMIHFTLDAVPSPWMREGSWWQLSTIGCTWCRTVVPSTKRGTYFVPLVAAARDPSSQDEEVEPSSLEFVMLVISFLDFLGGVNPTRGWQFSCQWWIVLTEQASPKLNRVSGGGVECLGLPFDTSPRSSKAFLNHPAFSNSSKCWFLLDSSWVVRTPESKSHMQKSISATKVGQQYCLNNSNKNNSGEPWSQSEKPTQAGRFLFIMITISLASSVLGLTACTLPITSFDWWTSAMRRWSLPIWTKCSNPSQRVNCNGGLIHQVDKAPPMHLGQWSQQDPPKSSRIGSWYALEQHSKAF